MNEGRPNIPKIESHLREGVKPIMACVASIKDNDRDFHNVENSRVDSAHYVDFFGDEDDFKEKNLLNAGRRTYVISQIDDLDKFSDDFFDCTSLIVTGIDKKTGKNISFISHQNPRAFLDSKRENFIADLEKKIQEIKERCEAGTIDSVIVGGNYNVMTKDEFSKLNIAPEEAIELNIAQEEAIEVYKNNYIESIELLSNEIKRNLNFEPVVINGPKNTKGSDFIYYDSENRRLYLERPKVNSNTRDFTAIALAGEKDKWDESHH